MSVWTHVAGVIRVDTITRTDAPSLGNTAFFEDDLSIWDKVDVPWGSEGSIHIENFCDKTETSIARYHYHIWGDLRDFDNENVMEQFPTFLNRIVIRLKEKNAWIRQAIIQCEVEYWGTVLFTYNHDESTWISSVIIDGRAEK